MRSGNSKDWKIEGCLGLCVNKRAVKRLEWLKNPLPLTTELYYLKLGLLLEMFTFRHLKKGLRAVALPWDQYLWDFNYISNYSATN